MTFIPSSIHVTHVYMLTYGLNLFLLYVWNFILYQRDTLCIKGSVTVDLCTHCLPAYGAT